MLDRGFHQTLAVGRDPDVHRDGSDPVGKLRLQLVEALPPSSAEHHACARTEQFPSGRAADPGACPGDDDDLVLE